MIDLKGHKVEDVIVYNDVCEMLGIEPVKATNTRKKHMKDIEQYMKLEQVGRGKWKIVEIYDSVQQREDKRGKSESSQKALKENRGHKPSFFHEDELQLAILWTLGSKYYESVKNEDSSLIFIPKNEMHIQLGLCNEYFNTLYRNRYYYCKLGKLDERQTAIDKWKVDLAFDLNSNYTDINNDMQRQVITAFNQLQRKKVLEFTYWKAYNDGKRDILFTDEHMKVFLVTREETFKWWNEKHPKKVRETIGDIYKLTQVEISEFEEELKRRLRETKEFKGLTYYFSCYKTLFVISSIKRELKKQGFEVGDGADDFSHAYIENMTYTVIKINNKFIQRHVERIDKFCDEQRTKLEQYETELENYYKQIEQQHRRGFGKRIGRPSKPKDVDIVLYDEPYADVLDILFLGLKLIEELTKEQRVLMQGIEHCIKVNTTIE